MKLVHAGRVRKTISTPGSQTINRRPADEPGNEARSLRALDALAYLAPDVQGAVDPFLVTFMSSALGCGARRQCDVRLGPVRPAGAGAGRCLVDHVRSKPLWIAAALGLIAGMAVGTGAAFSTLLAGTIAQHARYATSFVTLAAVAAPALLLVAAAMPETRRLRGPE